MLLMKVRIYDSMLRALRLRHESMTRKKANRYLGPIHALAMQDDVRPRSLLWRYGLPWCLVLLPYLSPSGFADCMSNVDFFFFHMYDSPC